MNKQDVTKLFKTAQKFVSRRSPEILTGLGIAGMCTTVVLAVKATPKAMELIEEEKLSKLSKTPSDGKQSVVYDLDKPLSPIETIKVAWKPYIPAALTGIASISCIIGASSVNARRNAALYSAYKLSETALSEYKDKVAETVGDKKVKEIKQKIAEDKVDKIVPASKEKEDDGQGKTKVIISEDGDAWFIDPYSNTPFRSNKNKIDAAAIKVSRNFIDDIFVSLSDFYDALDVPEIQHTATSDDLGWSADDVKLIEVDYSDAVVRDGRAYVVMDFLVRPHYGYDDKNRYYG